jgi:hypothetical protein
MREKTLTLSAFAKMRGVTRMTVHRWRNRGHVLLDEYGRVRVAASNAMLADRAETYRGGKIGGNAAKNAATNGNGDRRSGPHHLTTAEAIAEKETYLGLMRKLEYEIATGQVVDIGVVTSVVARDYQIVRNRLMGVGLKTGQMLATCDRVEECQAIIDAELVKALEGLDEDEAFEEIKRQAGATAADE